MRNLKFILNTFYSGPQAWFFLADDRGYFAREGIRVEFTQGDTLANAVPKIASGEFDVGYGDINALIEMNSQASSDVQALAVFATFNQSPYTIAVPANSTALKPADLMGLKLASHPNDAALRMLSEFALACGVDASRLIPELSTLPHSQMIAQMLKGTTWQGMYGFVNTLRAAAMEMGSDPDTDLRFFEYRHYVPSLYGAAVMVGRGLAQKEPELIAGFVRAINDGLRDTVNDIDAAIQAVAKRDPAINKAANRARLAGTLGLEMAHEEGQRLGIGDVDSERLNESIRLIVAAKKYAHTPLADDVFTRAFLPPLSARVATL